MKKIKAPHALTYLLALMMLVAAPVTASALTPVSPLPAERPSSVSNPTKVVVKPKVYVTVPENNGLAAAVHQLADKFTSIFESDKGVRKDVQDANANLGKIATGTGNIEKAINDGFGNLFWLGIVSLFVFAGILMFGMVFRRNGHTEITQAINDVAQNVTNASDAQVRVAKDQTETVESGFRDVATAVQDASKERSELTTLGEPIELTVAGKKVTVYPKRGRSGGLFRKPFAVKEVIDQLATRASDVEIDDLLDEVDIAEVVRIPAMTQGEMVRDFSKAIKLYIRKREGQPGGYKQTVKDQLNYRLMKYLIEESCEVVIHD